jgi:hypothetical protein
LPTTVRNPGERGGRPGPRSGRHRRLGPDQARGVRASLAPAPSRCRNAARSPGSHRAGGHRTGNMGPTSANRRRRPAARRPRAPPPGSRSGAPLAPPRTWAETAPSARTEAYPLDRRGSWPAFIARIAHRRHPAPACVARQGAIRRGVVSVRSM